MSLSHLIQLNNNPDSLKDILVSKGLSMREQPINEWQNLAPEENDFAYCSGKILSSHMEIYSICSKTNFYSILFPTYTTNQINQLQSLIALFNSILKEKCPSTYKNRSTFMFSKGCVSASTDEISLIYKQHSIYLKSYATVNFEYSLLLSDLSFDTLYNAILNDFNMKIKAMADSETTLIDTAFLTALQYESKEDFIKRTHNGNIANAIKVEDFNNYVEQLNLHFLTDSYQPNAKESDKKSLYFEDKYSKKTYIVGIQKINTLKTLLMPLVKENSLEKLINLFSIAQFYSKLFNPAFDNNVIKFAHLDIFDLTKENLSYKPDYFAVSTGIFDFFIGETIKIYQFTENTPTIFTSVDKAYDYLFDFIRDDICLRLDTHTEDIKNDTLLLLEMMVF